MLVDVVFLFFCGWFYRNLDYSILFWFFVVVIDVCVFVFVLDIEILVEICYSFVWFFFWVVYRGLLYSVECGWYCCCYVVYGFLLLCVRLSLMLVYCVLVELYLFSWVLLSDRGWNSLLDCCWWLLFVYGFLCYEF